MDSCNWIEMTDTYVTEDGTYFPIGKQYIYKDVIEKFREYSCQEKGCNRVMLHYVVCYKDIDYNIPSDVAVISTNGNTRPNNEVGGQAWRDKYRGDKSDWMKIAEESYGSFPRRKGIEIDLRKYKSIIGK